VPGWTAKIADAFHSFQSAAGRVLRRKIKSTPFPENNGEVPFNASGVVQVGPRRFLFIDNHEGSAFFEFTLDADDAKTHRIRRRRLVGVEKGQLGDPEGLTRVDLNGETYLIAASSLCIEQRHINDGLVRARYVTDGDLDAEVMPGFRTWLLSNEPSLAEVGDLEPDAGGLNIEGLAWDGRTRALLFGLRGPAKAGQMVIIRVPVDAGAAPWTTSALGAPTVLSVNIPESKAAQGIRDISYDEQTGDFLILLGRSLSRDDDPFRLCTWNGGDDVKLLDLKFHQSMKPEGVTTYSDGDHTKLLVVDDRGGYAVVNPRHRWG
jgi:uncharacterized protein DUF3616